MNPWYADLSNSDQKIARALQVEFEQRLGVNISPSLFDAFYINARYLPEFTTVPGSALKPLYLASKGRLPKAANFLYQQFSRNCIDDSSRYTRHSAIVNDLSGDGFHVIPNFLSSAQVDALLKELAQYEYYAPMQGKKALNLKDIRQADSDSPLYRVSTYSTNCMGQDIPTQSQLGQLMIDTFMADVASAYFKTQAYLTQTVGFYTRAKDPKLFTAAEIHGSAQKWHVDYSDLRFIKFFIYLTDVEPGNGPHTFAKRTHEEGFIYPKDKQGFHEAGFRVYDNGELDGVLRNEWVEQAVSKDRIKEFHGKRGTLIIENTSGLHKGGDCLSGTREMLSFTYAISNSGVPSTQPSIDYQPASSRHSHLTAVLKQHKAEQIEKYKAFCPKPTFKSRVKGKIKSLIGKK